MLNLITQLLPVVGEVIDRVVPDPKAREEANEIFTKLMGEEVEPRREFIVTQAKFVANLDV